MSKQKTKEISQQQLKELLHYCPDTGRFTWLVHANHNGALIGDTAGHIAANGYCQITVKRYSSTAHRLAFIYMLGRLPIKEVDHLNGVRDDNRWANLRDVSSTMNGRNKCLRSDNNMGIHGVYWREVPQRWEVQINSSYAGRYATLLDACCARKSLEIQYGYSTNHGRVAA